MVAVTDGLRLLKSGLRVLLYSSAFSLMPAVSGTAVSFAQQASGADANRTDEGLEEIVVTAQRRDENIQDVPISINAISEDQLDQANVTSVSDLVTVVPSLNIQRHGNTAQLYLRGIGSAVGNVNGESSVAVYVDGVYQPTGSGNWFSYNNVERIEVLKGPQGTLFGRNSTGGVVQIVTRDPSATPAADFSIDYANYNAFTASAYASTPIGSHAALNVALRYSDQGEGWGQNLTTGEETYLRNDIGGRAKLQITPDDDTQIILSAHYVNEESGEIAQPVPGSMTISGDAYPGRFNTVANTNTITQHESWGLSAKLEHDFNAFRVRSISAYQSQDGYWLLDADDSPLPMFDLIVRESTEMSTQEIHLLSPAEARFQWLVGAYYINYSAGYDPLQLAGLFFGPTPVDGLEQVTSTTTTSTSIFAQGTYPLSATTNLTLGARYTWEDIEYKGYLGLIGVPGLIIDPSNGVPASKSREDAEPTFRVALDHHFTPDIMGYVSFNRGVKSGNFGLSESPETVESYDPERLDAYEVGVKLEALDRLRLNAALFYYDGEDLQFQRVVGGSAVIVSGPSATYYGGELEIDFQATRNLSFTGNVTLLHGRFGTYLNAPSTIRLPDGTDAPGPADYDATGNTPPAAADFTGNIGFNYNIPTASLGDFTLSANVYRTSSYPAEVDNRLSVGPYTLLSSSLEWRPPGGVWYARVWGSNLLDEYYYDQTQAQVGLNDYGIPAAPRTFGVTVGASF